MHWRWFHAAGVALLVGVAAAAAFLIDDGQIALAISVAALLAVFVVIGLGITGRVGGAWIDERNKMTLSRLQLIIWTVVVMAGWLTAVLARVGVEDDALAVAVPQELWWLLGISTASLIGSPLILAAKRNQKPNKDETEETIRALNAATATPLTRVAAVPQLLKDDTGALRAVGHVEVRPSPTEASWADLFRGDETGNAAWVDVGKVQMLLFTLVIVVAYTVLLFQQFGGEESLTALPAVPESMIALLAISHAGYLATKAVSHSASAT